MSEPHEQTPDERQRVNDALNALENAGWIEKPARGLYRLVYDGESKVEQEIRHVDDEVRR